LPPTYLRFAFGGALGAALADHMDVWIETAGPGVDKQALKDDFERRLKEVLGLKVQVTPVDKGQLDPHTGTSSTSKVKRLLDRRNR
jgi:phenylacetate-coenzyme A ligase PaaK-like adenylate-forming protein